MQQAPSTIKDEKFPPLRRSDGNRFRHRVFQDLSHVQVISSCINTALLTHLPLNDLYLVDILVSECMVESRDLNFIRTQDFIVIYCNT
jgi:hypothetical protein